LPGPLRRRPFQVEGLCNGLTGHGELQREAPGVQRCLRPGLPLPRRTGLPIVGVDEEGGKNRGDERGVQERLHRAGSLGIHLVLAVDRLIQFDAQVDLPADPIEVGDWPGPKSWGQLREEEAIALRRVAPHQAQMQRLFGTLHTHVGINGVAIEDKELLIEKDIEGSAGAERLGDLTTR
jgi:hypothetical protein